MLAERQGAPYRVHRSTGVAPGAETPLTKP